MNLENHPRPLRKGCPDTISRTTFSFGQDMEPYKIRNTQKSEKNILPDARIKNDDNNTYHASTINENSPPPDEFVVKTQKRRGECQPKTHAVFGSPIEPRNPCSVFNQSYNSERNAKTVFDRGPEKSELLTVYDGSFEANRIDSFSNNGSTVLRNTNSDMDLAINDLEISRKFPNSVGQLFVESEYGELPEKKNMKMHLVRRTPTAATEIDQIMTGEPANQVEVKQRSSNTFTSQVLGSSPNVIARPKNTQKGVWSTNFNSGGCTFPDAVNTLLKCSKKGTELKSRRMNDKCRSIGPLSPQYEQVSNKNTLNPVSRTSKITQSTVFDHYSQPTPNTSKRGYGRITQSTIF